MVHKEAHTQGMRLDGVNSAEKLQYLSDSFKVGLLFAAVEENEPYLYRLLVETDAYKSNGIVYSAPPIRVTSATCDHGLDIAKIILHRSLQKRGIFEPEKSFLGYPFIVNDPDLAKECVVDALKEAILREYTRK